ncbi:MAG: SusC/RagA family TonB-linked outer membrane protein [Sphingobacteriales bacterium]|nr:SusC/RagA family TonB-linked outer membrane protein [Sphingobacteriales bacterium]
MKSKLYARITGRLLLLLFLILSLQGRGQSFTLSVKRETLGKVFLQVEQQSEFRFIYTEELLAQSEPVSFTARNISLDSLLRLCFRNQPLTYTTEGKHIIVRKLIEKPAAVTRELRGRVVNEQGEPVPGATIAIKQTKFITVSDGNGEFVFPSAPLHVILLISGAEISPQELVAGNQPFILVTIQQKLGILDESIVIAYGKTTKRTSTGTVSKVSREEIDKQPVNNVLAGIEGRITGLQIAQTSGLPGSNFSIRLRGQNSIANGNEPLYIVDGVPFPSNTMTSVMGGGGGANASPLASINPGDIESVEILKDADATAIYGSRGANGVILITTRKAKTTQTKVEAKLYTGWGRVTRLLPLLGLSDYLAMRREAFANDGTTPTVSNARDLKVWDSTRYTDWQRLLIGNSMHLTDLNIGVSGGSGQTQLYINGGYHKESTIIPGNFGEEKISISFNSAHTSLNRRFRIGLGGSYLKNNTVLPKEDISTNLSLAPNAPALYTAEGKYNWENSTWINPMALLERKYKVVTGTFMSNLNLSYNIGKGLDAKMNFGFSSIQMQEHVTTPGRSQDPALAIIVSAGFGNNRIETFIAEPQLSYKVKWGKGNFQILTGSTLQGTDQQALVQSGSGYQSDDLLKSLQAAASVVTVTDLKTKYRYGGIFSRVAMDWDGKYFLTLNGRRDGSSRYGPANRFANFGSVGAGWIFSKESLFAAIPFLSYGKCKISTGITGNDQIGDYKYLDSYSPYTYTYQNVTTLTPTQLFNPAYSWEKVVKTEAGLDLGFLKDRILLSVNFYNNITGNQLVQYALPGVTGFQGILRNLPARIRNYGWEFEMNGTILQSEKLKWSARLTLTVPRNKLLEFEGLAGSSYANTYVIGRPLSISKRFTYTGVDTATGNYTFADANSDGRISSPADLSSVVFTGQQYFGGFENNIRIKGITIGIFAQFVRIKNTSTYISRFTRPGAMSNQPTYVLGRWQYRGQVSEVQKFSNSNSLSNAAFTNFRNSNMALGDGSYIRVKNINISYDLPARFCSRAGLKEGAFFVQAQNLFTISSYKGLDPETKAVIPPLKVIIAGLRLTL